MTATAMRLRRPKWRDPRLIIGIVLVLLSVLAGMLVVSRASATSPVVVAKTDLVPGQTIRAQDLTTVQMRLPDGADSYLSSTSQIPAGAVAVAVVRSGELVPAGAVGQPEASALRPVVVAVDSGLAAEIRTGARVELWGTPASRMRDQRAKAVELVPDGIVRSVQTGSSLGMKASTVEVLVPAGRVSTVLESLAAGDRIDVVQVPGGAGAAR